LFIDCFYAQLHANTSTQRVSLSVMGDVQSRQWVTGSDPRPTDPHKSWPMTQYPWPMTHRF